MKSILVGYGYWGKIVEKYILSSGQFELISICDPSYPGGEQLDDVLMCKDVECAFVCVPVDLHYKIVKKLVNCKVHVFCEKPLCKGKEETEELLRLAESNGVTLFTDYIYTVSKAIACMRDYSRKLGKLDYIDMSIMQFGKFYPSDNVFEVLGVHMISSFLFLLDNPENIEVVSALPIKTSFSSVIEEGILFLKCKDVVGKIQCSLLSNTKERKIRMICERGMIVFDMLSKDTVQIVEFINEKDTTTYEITKKIQFDESNNLQLALEEFGNNILVNSKTNAEITRNVSKVMEKISELMQIVEERL